MAGVKLRIAVTGTPGVGKTTVSGLLAQRLKCKAVNEKAFAFAKGIGSWNTEDEELEISPSELRKALNLEIGKAGRIVAEGHLLCEMKLDVDFAVLIRLDPELLEARLERRGYRPEKISDNVFCEGIDYCRKHLLRNYAKSRVIEVRSQRTAGETAALIISELGKRGAKL
jgi:adenylate kinase